MSFLEFPKRSIVGLETDIDHEDPSHSAKQHDNQRDLSRNFLGKCSQEVAYHVIPGYHPPLDLHEPPEMYRNRHHMQTRQPHEDQYGQPHQQHGQNQFGQIHQKQSHPNHVNMVREPSVHQPMMSNYPGNHNYAISESRPPGVSQEVLEKRTYEQQRVSSAPLEGRPKHLGEIANLHDRRGPEGHPFDSFNKQSEEQLDRRPPGSDNILVDEADGWNFDEPSTDEPPVIPAQPHRPDQDVFPNANFVTSKSPPRPGPGPHRRKSSGSRRRSDMSIDLREGARTEAQHLEPSSFKVRFALRGHLDVVRSIIFTGGGSPSEPEVCTCGDDGIIKRWILPASYGNFGPGASSSNDLDITAYFTHRGHNGSVTCLAACPPSRDFSNGGRALGDGWVFSGGQDGTVRVWERGRVDAKATLEGHTDAVWALCVLPGTSSSILGERSSRYGGPDRILLASGGADGKVLIWAVSSPPQLSSPQTSSRSRGGSRRANSISSGSNFPSSPQPSTATATPFHYTLVHRIDPIDSASPTCIAPLSPTGVNFVVSYTDATVIVYDTRTGEQVVGMASLETYDGTPSTGVNAVVASTIGFNGTAGLDPNRPLAEEETVVHGATGTSGGVEGVIISGHEDRYIRLFDANSGMSLL